MNSSANYNAMSVFDFIGGLFFGSSEQRNDTYEDARLLTEINEKLEAKALYYMVCFIRKENNVIRDLLGGFLKKHYTWDQDDEELIWDLAYRVFEIVSICYDPDKQTIKAFFKDYQIALEYLGKSNGFDKQVTLNEPCKDIMEILKTRRYAIKEGKAMTIDFQMQFFNYYHTESLKEKKGFEAICKELPKEDFIYYQRGLRKACHEGLLTAVEEGPRLLKKFIASHKDKVLSKELVNDSSSGEPCLMKVVKRFIEYQSGVEIVNILCNAGADVNVCDRNDNTLLHIAANHEQWSVIPLLIQKGANPCRYNDQGRTPLSAIVDQIYMRSNRNSWAQRLEEQEASIKALLSKDTLNQPDQPNVRTTWLDYLPIKDATPFFKLIFYFSRLLEVTISTQGNNNIDSQNLTFEHFSNQAPLIASILNLCIKKGADLNTTDSFGNTLMHYLAGSGNHNDSGLTEVKAKMWVEVLYALNQYAPLKSKTNNHGKTPEVIARNNGQNDLAYVIKQNTFQSSGSGLRKMFQR